jgi:arsenate reductase-like glutaredoxin family protein
LPRNLSAVIFRETLIPQLNPKTYIFTYIGDREIFERNIVDMKLQGFNSEEVKNIVADYIELLKEKPNIYELRGIMGEIGIPIEKPQNKKEIQEKFLEEFEKLDKNKLKQFIKKFEVRYVIREKAKNEDETFLKEIFKSKDFYIYEIEFGE